METREHWEAVYRTNRNHSWHQAEPRHSVELIEECAPDRDAAIIDVGGGDSLLVDALLDRGHSDITVLDISAAALHVAHKRLGVRAALVKWIVSDVLTAVLPDHHFCVWHDRAVFHFLTLAEHRKRYVHLMKEAIKPGGCIVMATFGPNGPLKCSGLDVMRYSGRSLLAELGAGVALLESSTEIHATPSGAHQEFQYSRFRMA
jgi:trans-aconitate methyltransferase